VPLAKSENLVFIDVILLVEKISKLEIVLFLIIQTIFVILFLHHFYVFWSLEATISISIVVGEMLTYFIFRIADRLKNKANPND
jgi:hypothetical protein